MKKLLSLVLVMCMLMTIATPAMAYSEKKEIQPRGSLSLRGSLVYDSSVAKYYFSGRGIGATEMKTVTATLYRSVKGDWIYVDSSSSSGTTGTVTTGKHVSLISGSYKLTVRGITVNSDASTDYYYNI